MTIFDVEKILKEFAERNELKEKSLRYCLETLEESIKVNEDLGEDFLSGYTKEELIFGFDRHELHFNRVSQNSVIRTHIGIYIKDYKGIWFRDLEPIGFYELEVDLDGEILDDYINMEKEKYKN